MGRVLASHIKERKTNMGRLPNWNYKAPYYYMVTMKCLPGLPPLAILDGKAPHGVRAEYPLTARLQKVIFQFVERTPTVESVSPFVIMPDHLHLLIKIADIPERKSLADVVDLLRRLLRNAFQEEIGQKIPLFENEWHDLIVKKEKQLKNFRA